jgi:hypothetical protein
MPMVMEREATAMALNLGVILVTGAAGVKMAKASAMVTRFNKRHGMTPPAITSP